VAYTYDPSTQKVEASLGCKAKPSPKKTRKKEEEVGGVGRRGEEEEKEK
jgi:hypothetical protein